MKKYICLFATVLLCVPAIVEAFMVPNEVLDLSALPSCAPTRFSDEDIADKNIAPGDASGEAESLSRYYLSQLIGLKENEEPPYAAIISSPWQETELKTFSTRMVQIATENDICDRVAILYSARFQKHFCPDSTTYQKLNPEAQKNVNAILHWPGKVFQLAKRVSNCNLR